MRLTRSEPHIVSEPNLPVIPQGERGHSERAAPVIFRYHEREKDLFAVLPTVPADLGSIMMYSHVGPL